MIDISRTSVRDMRRLLTQIKKLDPEIRKRLQRQFREIAQRTLVDTRGRQPTKTGNLRKKTTAGARAGWPYIRSRADYARISEFGGTHPIPNKAGEGVYQPPAPAIFPAVKAGQSDYFNAGNRALYEALKEIEFK